jgi:BirA family biotin operon repressor/biotin-[acetyl-CoA-carboxylase] ligase
MSTLFSPERIQSFCRGAAEAVAIGAVEETGSTNSDLLNNLDRLSAPTLLIAERQTGGRGRAGRPWHSRPGASLTFSLAWKFDVPLHALLGLPLAVGVAIADALAMFNVNVRLKWPNDVLHEGRKLAGILIETASSESGHWAVTGVGINMAIDADLAASIGRPAAAIPWLMEVDRDMLVATLLNQLAETMTQFAQTGFAGVMARWNALHAYEGLAVTILDNGTVLHEGTAAGVDESGRFLLDTVNGRVAVMAGDVSLRVAGA